MRKLLSVGTLNKAVGIETLKIDFQVTKCRKQKQFQKNQSELQGSIYMRIVFSFSIAIWGQN